MDVELEELKQLLRSKRFSLDEVRPLAERAVRAIDRLEAENHALAAELLNYHAAESRLRDMREAIKALLAEHATFKLDEIVQRLAAILDNPPGMAN